MYDALEIGLDWKGTLQTLSSVPGSKCSILIETLLVNPDSSKRAILTLEETVLDSPMGKLVWGKRDGTDYLMKRPSSQRHAKQEAVIQWLCNKTLKEYSMEAHCPQVFDIFKTSSGIWFSMTPIYKAPTLAVFLQSLTSWNTQTPANGIILLKLLCQVATCCLILDRNIGFNHRDLKPDNILVQTSKVSPISAIIPKIGTIVIAESPLTSIVDFGFACLGPGKTPWIQSGDDVLSPFDACPRVGRDLFMILVFLVWRPDLQKSLVKEHFEFLKTSIHLTNEMLTLQNPSTWIYSLVTERRFQCLDLDPLKWLQSCSTTFPEIVSILDQPGSYTVA